MKVAITSKGGSLDALLDERFGRCAYFAVHDTEKKSTEFIKNPNVDVDEGAGPASVGIVANQGVKKIVSGEFGFKIKGMLNDLGIQMVMVKEDKTVAEIIELLDK